MCVYAWVCVLDGECRARLDLMRRLYSANQASPGSAVQFDDYTTHIVVAKGDSFETDSEPSPGPKTTTNEDTLPVAASTTSTATTTANESNNNNNGRSASITMLTNFNLSQTSSFLHSLIRNNLSFSNEANEKTQYTPSRKEISDNFDTRSSSSSSPNGYFNFKSNNNNYNYFSFQRYCQPLSFFTQQQQQQQQHKQQKQNIICYVVLFPIWLSLLDMLVFVVVLVVVLVGVLLFLLAVDCCLLLLQDIFVL